MGQRGKRRAGQGLERCCALNVAVQEAIDENGRVMREARRK